MKKKIKILITGKNGQLARTIINQLKNKYNFYSYSKKKIDITKRKDLLKLSLNNSAILINTAAYNDVESSEINKKDAIKTNFLAIKNLKKICDKNNIFFIHFSTDYVFNGKKKLYGENSRVNPINQYGKSKANGEKFLLDSKTNNYIILRLSWVYSKIGKNFYTKIITLIKKRKKISVVNDQFGVPTSTKFISFYLDKIIQNVVYKKKMSLIYHLTPNGKTTWYEFSVLILDFFNKTNKYKFKSIKIIPKKSNFINKAKRPLYSILNSKKIQKKLKIKFKNWKYYFDKEFA